MINIKIPTSREQTITEGLFAMAGLDDDKMLFNAGFEQWKNKFKELLGIYDNIDQTILRRVIDEVGILLEKRTEDSSNYVLKVRRPDGSVIHILIPVEGEYYDSCIKDCKGSPFGLNFVTRGHYS